VRLGRVPVDRRGFLLAGPANPRLFPRAIWHQRALEEALAAARRRGTRVLFFWPPLPAGGFGREMSRYREIQRHIRSVAAAYGLAVWMPRGPWPDALFLDNFGHLNANGRKRFAVEIGDWAAAQ
jgi:hypothetical protein